jgi:hypothetical protein
MMDLSIDPTTCTNSRCRRRGVALRVPRGSFTVGVLLCIFILPIGLLYFLLRSGYTLHCTACGTEIGRAWR